MKNTGNLGCICTSRLFVCMDERRERIMLRLWKECEGAENIVISGHIRPDGDCVGSCMAAYLYLKKVMPQADVRVFLEQPAEIFSCIQDFDKIEDNCETKLVPDVFIALDCEKTRLGEAEVLFDKAKKTINIDHHISNAQGCGDVNYIVPTASSTAELIYDVIDKEFIDIEIAKAIYIGIIHDTGIFQYSNTSPKTMQTAGELISYGFDFPALIDETFYEKTYVQNQILGRALLESIMFMDGKCVVSYVDQKTMNFYHVTSKDLDGIVNQLRIIKGVECAIFMYETGVQQYKVSLRSCKYVDVSKVAAYFGGGGHVRAAGCTLNGSFHDVVNNLSEHIEEQIKEHEIG